MVEVSQCGLECYQFVKNIQKKFSINNYTCRQAKFQRGMSQWSSVARYLVDLCECNDTKKTFFVI